MGHAEIAYDVDGVLPCGMRIQGSTTYQWPNAAAIEAEGGIVIEADDDGTPLVVLWTKTCQFSLNGERLSYEEMEIALETISELNQKYSKKASSAKGFGRE